LPDTHTNGKTRGICPCPQWIIDRVQQRIGGSFDLDVAASADNAKAPKYFTAEQDGLKQEWVGKRIWVNVPYNKERLGEWIARAYNAAKEDRKTVACLLPLWHGYDWWRDYVSKGEIIHLQGFGYGPAGKKRHDCVVVIFRPDPDSRAGRTDTWKRGDNATESNKVDWRKVAVLAKKVGGLKQLRESFETVLTREVPLLYAVLDVAREMEEALGELA